MVGDPLTIAAAMAGTSPLLATDASTEVVPSAGSTAQLPSVPVPVKDGGVLSRDRFVDRQLELLD